MSRFHSPPLSPKNAEIVSAAKRVVARDFKLDLASFDLPGRDQPRAFARQIAMYIVRRLVTVPVAFNPKATTPISFPSIAAAFARDDHGTAMHAVKAIERKFAEDLYLRARVDRLAAEVHAEVKKARAA